MSVDLIQPTVQPLALLRAERFPDLLRDQRQRVAEDRHLDEPLIIIAHLAPILLMLRVRAGANAVQNDLP
ncbi:hypothetical protein HMSSN139_48330 [Paenibacillus sp. HMSSN-139]|nr:hypothetical protein HMSSN139_48330 [Paenibacillus sp. HMSSN-139]